MKMKMKIERKRRKKDHNMIEEKSRLYYLVLEQQLAGRGEAERRRSRES